MLSEIFYSIPLVILISVIAMECWKEYMNQTKLKAFCHLRGWPVIGSVFMILGKNYAQMFGMFKRNELSYCWVGPVLVFHIDRPEDVQAILTSDLCLKKAFPYKFLYTRSGLLTSHPNIWKNHRRTLNPRMGPKMVHSFFPIFNEKFKKMCDLMDQKLNTNIDVNAILFSASLDVGLSTSCGLNWPIQNSRSDEIHSILMDGMKTLQDRIKKCWLWWAPIFELSQLYKIQFENFAKIRQFRQNILEVKRMDLAVKLVHDVDELALAKGENRQNFLQKCLQMELEGKWTTQEVRDEMDTMLIASTDTSSTVLTGVVIMLAIHQEYQERVVDEMREIFDKQDEPVTREHLAWMTFLELVIKESMRHFPVAPVLGRECMEDFPINGGVIPKGSQIILNMLQMNMDPKYYGENANEFYPERFLLENSAHFHPYLFIPFSAGPRNCMGYRYAWASMKIALAHILRRFKLTTDLRMQDIIIHPDLILTIRNKNPIRIEQRQW